MAHTIVMPRLGWTMEEGTFGAWLKEDGADVAAGDLLFTVESDKATQEVESFEAGILRIAPDGRIDDRIALPGQVTASVMFGGPDLDLMFVTTLGRPFWGIDPQGADAGAVFVIEGSGFRGLPERRFAG